MSQKFGDRVKKPRYPDGTTRICRTLVKPYNLPKTEAIFWWTNATEMRNDLREKGCFPGVCKYEGCWLEFYPEHRCKYRLTLPKI